jgi:hypothetical protein
MFKAVTFVFVVCLHGLFLFSSASNNLFPAAFPFKDGFLGGDAIYSIPINTDKVPGRYLWLYGDTFWNSQPGNITRTFEEKDFPSNTVGITQVVDEKVEFSYYRGKGVQPYGIFNYAPASMVGITDEQRQKLRIWPKDGHIVGDSLWVGLVLIVESENMFDTLGVDYARIDNPTADPNEWTVTYIESLRSSRLFPATSLQERDGFLYSLTTLISGPAAAQKQSYVILRYPSVDFDISKNTAEYYSAVGTWKALALDSATLTVTEEDTVIEDMGIISKDGNTEASLHYDEKSGKWILIASRGVFTEATVGMMVADAPTGPWSAPLNLIDGKYPENTRSSDEYIEGVFCYAGKGHPELSYEYYTDAMVITYACNSFSLDQLLDDNSVYTPKLIVVEDFQSKISQAATQME